ncbi:MULTISPECIES: shikimate kinase [unclassified Devosia]|uniref:shikimate kinase n=1 Tax=unclassified Devosia TaxID=196773 RepID=UPI00155558AD|nr:MULTISPECIES: shikimate kinase [unclassified Devosia]
MSRSTAANRQAQAQLLVELLDGRPLALVGMMGAGKTTVGRRLANRMGRQFLDSDEEIEKAAQMSIPEIFAQRGEAEFRAGETRVISRVLKHPDLVLATGGGAFVHPETRAVLKSEAVSVWIKADTDLLFQRVSRRSNRPLLQTANPRETLERLVEERYPIYAEADVTVVSRDVPQETVASDLVEAVLAYLQEKP